MERYGNLSGTSGITHYAIEADCIRVQFGDGATYTYDNLSPGAEHVERMTVLAIAGRGLGTYISQHVGKRYARKER